MRACVCVCVCVCVHVCARVLHVPACGPEAIRRTIDEPMGGVRSDATRLEALGRVSSTHPRAIMVPVTEEIGDAKRVILTQGMAKAINAGYIELDQGERLAVATDRIALERDARHAGRPAVVSCEK